MPLLQRISESLKKIPANLQRVLIQPAKRAYKKIHDTKRSFHHDSQKKGNVCFQSKLNFLKKPLFKLVTFAAL